MDRMGELGEDLPGRRSLLAVVLVVAGLALAPGSAGAATITPTAGYTVDNFLDNTKCSLREAVEIADTNDVAVEDACVVTGNFGADTIKLGKGTYALTRPEDGTPDDNDQGDLDVFGGPLVIDGAGAGLTKISAAGFAQPDRALHAFNTKMLTVQELTVTGGHASGAVPNGGGIDATTASTSVRLLHAEVTGSSADGGGGGVFSNGNLTVEDSDVTGNTAQTGGGIYASGATVLSKGSLVQGNTSTGIVGGGGIQAGGGSLSVMSSTVDDNHATAGNGGGISITNSVSSALVKDSQITNNTAPSTNGAGGIQNVSALTVSGQTEIAGNHAGGGGGIGATNGSVLLVTGPVHLHDNSATDANLGSGGAISSSGDTTVNGATLEDNDARSGGAVSYGGGNLGQLSILNSTIHGNVATSGGGGIVTTGPTTITGSEISSNAVSAPDDATSAAHLGGGIVVSSGADATISDSTISTNGTGSADPDDGVWGGGIGVFGKLTLLRSTVSGNLLLGGLPSSRLGAGIMVSPGSSASAELENSTLSGNAAPAGSGEGGALDVGAGTTATVLQSTIAGNSALTAPGIDNDGTTKLIRSIVDQGGVGCTGPITANARNLDAGMACVGAVNDTDLEFANAMLGPLANNGGPTRTRALLPGSPAINAIPNVSACTGLDKLPLTTDQRGFPRPVPAGGACDSGAFEVQG
jgi:hypothetical protein